MPEVCPGWSTPCNPSSSSPWCLKWRLLKVVYHSNAASGRPQTDGEKCIRFSHGNPIDNVAGYAAAGIVALGASGIEAIGTISFLCDSPPPHKRRVLRALRVKAGGLVWTCC